MSADLTPPADAPLPWSIHIENDDTIDLDDGRSEYFGTLKCIEYTVARYLVAAANAYPGLVAERDALQADLDVAANDLTRFRMQYLTVADAIAPSSNNAHELADRVRAFRNRAEALEAELTAERDAHHATCDALARERAECERLRGLLKRATCPCDSTEEDRAIVRGQEKLDVI